MPRKRRRSTRQPGETRGRKTLVDLVLEYKHSINQDTYGPGPVYGVPSDVAAVLMEQERNVNDRIEAEHRERSSLILPAGRVIPVHNDFFDFGNLEQMRPSIVVNRGSW